MVCYLKLLLNCFWLLSEVLMLVPNSKHDLKLFIASQGHCKCVQCRGGVVFYESHFVF